MSAKEKEGRRGDNEQGRNRIDMKRMEERGRDVREDVEWEEKMKGV